MFFGTSKKLDKLKSKIGTLDIKLTTSFENVLADVKNLYAWIDYLNSIITDQNIALTEIKTSLNNIPKDKKEIKNIVDEYYAMHPIAEKIEELSQRINAFESDGINSQEINDLKAKVSKIIHEYPVVLEALEDIKVRVNSIHKEDSVTSRASRRSSTISERRQYSLPKLQEKMMKSVARSSKEYVKTIIISLIKKYKNISAIRLRDIIVDEQGIASKSSFYRMLEELEKSGSVEMIRTGKEKQYFALEKVQKV